MEKVTYYKAEDGKGFPTEEECLAHDADLAIGRLIEEEVPYSDGKHAVASFIEEHGEQLLELLTTKYKYKK